MKSTLIASFLAAFCFTAVAAPTIQGPTVEGNLVSQKFKSDDRQLCSYAVTVKGVSSQVHRLAYHTCASKIEVSLDEATEAVKSGRFN